MENKEIIDFYKKGYSIEFISNLYYKNKNSTVKKNYWENGTYIVTPKEISKKDAEKHVLETIYNYNVKKEV